MDSTIAVAIITAVGGIATAAVALLKKSNHKDGPIRLPEASRDFVIGRWTVEQTIGIVSGEALLSTTGGSDIIYEADGKFIGSQFIAEKKVLREGHWEFTRLSKDVFRLKVQFEDQQIPVWRGDFQIVDQDRIHNIEQNYDAFRVKA